MDKHWTDYLPNRVVKRRLRKAAIRRVRKELIMHGKTEQEFAPDDLEYLVADAEIAIKNDLQKAGLIGALALLGFGI